MTNPIWRLPIPQPHRVAASAGGLSFVGGAGDFDHEGRIRNPGDLEAQIAGSLRNAADALATESASLDDAVRVKAFYRSDGTQDEWSIIAAIARAFEHAPLPAISVLPVPLQPFADQEVQIQLIANRGWREGSQVRVDTRPIPATVRDRFTGDSITSALRAGELIATANRTAVDASDHIDPGMDAVAQSHHIMDSLEASLTAVGASLQDSVKMEGYYFGTSRAQWAPLAQARASHFKEPGPPATVVPCHLLWPASALTKIEVLAMRQRRATFDKYIPREDSWPDRVWDWPLPLPYRQGIRLRDTIWLGGQVPSAPFSNSGERVLPAQLVEQTIHTMSYIDDLLAEFGRRAADLGIAVCYYACTGPEDTARFVQTVTDCAGGVLPPVTLVAQPHMHTPEVTVEIWGVARG